MAKKKHTALGAELIEAMDEVRAHRRGELALESRAVVPKSVDVAKIRRVTGLSQSKFARRFGFDVRTLQDWEQGHRQPDRAARLLLTVIDKEPKAVERALLEETAT